MYEEDTIAAIATPPGEGGIGIIRISGRKAEEVALCLFSPNREETCPLDRLRSHYLHYGKIIDPRTNLPLDQVLLAIMRRPHSYTGEDVVEIQGHGGPLLMRRVLEVVLNQGVRLAQPGEFTKRAFLNGRLDLTQAEAVLDLIRAKSEQGLRLAWEHLDGGLSRRTEEIRDLLVSLTAYVEAYLDFPEEDIPERKKTEMEQELTGIAADLFGLAQTFSQGKVYREGVRTAIVGKPNVGKSSLLNLLVGEERAIVTPIPGTTRDILEETAVIGEIPLVIWDTAGLHRTTDEVERIGVQKAKERMNSAQLVIAMLDSSRPLDEDDREILSGLYGRKGLILLNKIDLPPAIDKENLDNLGIAVPVIPFSIKKAWGMDELKTAIQIAALGENRESNVMVSRLRHRDALTKAGESLRHSHQSLCNGMPLDLIAVDLRAALDHIGEITGHVTTEDILDRIFSEFCIGK
jgi:tRNA modification GTPase